MAINRNTPKYRAKVKAEMAKKAAAVAGTPAPADTPGVSNAARVNPFYNPQNVIDLGNFKFGQDTTYAQIDQNLRDMATNATYQRSQNDKAATAGFGATNDDAAARGIFQSSIRDGNLADIEGQRTANNALLKTQLDNAQLAAEAQRTALTSQATTVIKGMDQQAVQNADEINSGIIPDAPPDPTAVPAAPAAPAAPSAPAGPLAPRNPFNAGRPAAQPSTPPAAPPPSQPFNAGAPAVLTHSQPAVNSLGHHGTWHYYSDGQRVWVPS